MYDRCDNHDLTVCVKLYPGEDGRGRGMVNEITGWLITHALGLPQPSQAYVVKVPLGELESPLPDWVRELKKSKTKTHWAFATAKLPAESAALNFKNEDIPLLIDDVKKWEVLPRVVALDEHIANTDRHLNNLLRLGKAKYALIDNGRLAVEGSERNWQTAYLRPDNQFTNKLSLHCWQDAPPVDKASIAVNAGSQHPDALSVVRDELMDWWERLIPDPVERSSFDHFITSRANTLSFLLSQRYRLLPL